MKIIFYIISLILFSKNIFAYKDFVENKSELNINLFKNLTSDLVVVEKFTSFIEAEEIKLNRTYKINILDKYKVYEKEFKLGNIEHFKNIKRLEELKTKNNKNFIWEKIGSSNSNHYHLLFFYNTISNINFALNIIDKIKYLKLKNSVRIIFLDDETTDQISIKAHLKNYLAEYRNKNIQSVTALNHLIEKNANPVTIKLGIQNKFTKDINTHVINILNENKKNNYDHVTDLDEHFICNQLYNSNLPCVGIEFTSSKTQKPNHLVNLITSIFAK